MSALQVPVSWLQGPRVKRAAIFALTPMLGIFSPLLVVPAVTSHFGVEGWASFAIGQSVGAAVAVPVEMGWSLIGPQAVSAASKSQQLNLFADSLFSRLAVFIVLSPLAFFVAFAISRDSYALVAGLSALSALSVGLTFSWYFIGASDARGLIICDAVPRMFAAILAAAFLYFGSPLTLLPFTLLAGGVLSVLIAHIYLRAGTQAFQRARWRLVRGTVRHQLLAVGGRAASAVYLSLPTALVGVIAPGSVAVFAAIDRMQRLLLQALQSVPGVFQAYVGAAEGKSVARRLKLSLALNVVCGLIVSIFYAVLLRPIAAVLFSGTITIGPLETFLSAALIALTVSSRATGGLGLVKLKRIGWLTMSAITGAISLIILLPVLTTSLGAVGALFAVVLAEVLVLTAQLVGLARSWPTIVEIPTCAEHQSPGR